MRRKIFSLLLAAAVVFGYSVPALNSSAEVHASTTKTQAQAIAWVQSQVGRGIDDDGVYGCQCVDLIRAYYKALGVSAVSGNGKDYATNALPSGWSRVAGGTPQKGDILVYGASSGNQYGHVAIYEGDYATYHQNFNSHSYVEKITNIRYNGFTNPYWGYIRPDWTTNNNPIGYLDSAVGGTGTITLRGWAFDSDAKGTSIPVHVYIGGEAGSASAECRVVYTNVSRPDVNQKYGLTGNHGFDTTISTTKTGTQPIYLYGINTPSGNNPQIASGTVTITKDSSKPVVSNVSVTNVSSTGYTVSCTVTDTGSGVNRVQFPTWTSKNEQDDLVANWTTNSAISGTKNGNTYTFRVNVSAHNNESGRYCTDVYAWDNAGNESGRAAALVTYVPCAVHGSTEIRNAKAATCTEDGYTGDTYCTVCGTKIKNGETIPAAGHKWDAGLVTKAATETEDGIMKYTCTVCYETKEVVIPKTGGSSSGGNNNESGSGGNNGSASGNSGSSALAAFPAGTQIPVAGSSYKIVSAGSKTVEFTKAANKKSVTVPDTVNIAGTTCKVVKVGAKAFKAKKIRKVTIGANVSKIAPNAFKGSKATKMIVKTKLLNKASVKKSLKGSKIKTVQVKAGSSKYKKLYKKIFTKKNAGKKVKVK